MEHHEQLETTRKLQNRESGDKGTYEKHNNCRNERGGAGEHVESKNMEGRRDHQIQKGKGVRIKVILLTIGSPEDQVGDIDGQV